MKLVGPPINGSQKSARQHRKPEKSYGCPSELKPTTLLITISMDASDVAWGDTTPFGTSHGTLSAWVRVQSSALGDEWGPFTVERFASASNNQSAHFNSFFFLPGCEGLDCFVQDRAGENNWCNPPFSQLGRLWRFLKVHALQATVLAPAWPSN